MRALLLLLLLGLPLALAACVRTGEGTAPPPGRPANAPDWLIMGFSGQLLVPLAGNHNREYLITDGGLAQLADAIIGAGQTVQVWDHASEFYSYDDQGNPWHPWDSVEFTTFGFLHAVQELEYARDNWIAGQDNPTRVVVVGHDHGAVWAHTAMFVIQDVPVELLVDLNADSTGWGSEGVAGVPPAGWDSLIQEWSRVNNAQWPYDIWDAEDSFIVDGYAELFDVEDVAPAWARTNLEVFTTTSELFQDDEPSVRADGTALGIEALESFDAHARLPARGSEAMNRATELLLELLAQ